MKPFNISVPCSPGDVIYYVRDEDEIERLFVTHISVTVKNWDHDIKELLVAVNFSGRPYIDLDTINRRCFSTLEEAKKYQKEFRKNGSI